MTKKAAVIKGDGTAPELVNAMLHVLKECNTQIELVLCEAGSEQWKKHGGQTYIPEETQKIMDESDACYKDRQLLSLLQMHQEVLQFRPDKNLSCMQM